MKIFLPIVCLLIIVFATGCTAKKGTSTESANGESLDNESGKLNSAYKQGTIQLSTDDGACPVTIKLADTNYGYLLDPVNIEDKFKQDGLAVWIKYTPLRMQNRCDNAHPVDLTEIKKSRP